VEICPSPLGQFTALRAPLSSLQRLERYAEGVATRLADLPQPLASAVARARARVSVRPTTFPRREIDPVIAAWVNEAIASGVLAEAIVEVANADPDLA
jgi:hypothetical protein